MEVTQEYLHECFSYNKDSGELFWRTRPLSHFKTDAAGKSWNSRQANTFAGHASTMGGGKTYVNIIIGGKMHKAHRIIWIMCYGEWPNQVDHINGDGTDNRLSNLRNVTQRENRLNTRRQSNNTSGLTGVSWCKRSKKWMAHIHIDGRMKNLGMYKNIFDAACKRISTQNRMGFHENHGSERPL